MYISRYINHLNAKLNPICHLLVLLLAHHIFHVSGVRVKTFSFSIVLNLYISGPTIFCYISKQAESFRLKVAQTWLLSQPVPVTQVVSITVYHKHAMTTVPTEPPHAATRHFVLYYSTLSQCRTQEFCSGGVQQIQLRTEDRENGDLGAVAPQSGVLEAAVIWSRNFIPYSKIFLIFGTLRLFMMTTNLFVIANVKQL